MNRCTVCTFTEEHGHYPSGTHSHCDGCHRSWRGHSECHCTSCHRHFGGETAFDAHRVDGICRDPAMLKTRTTNKPRFKVIERLDGVVWVAVRSGPNRYVTDDRERRRASEERRRAASATLTRSAHRSVATYVHGKRRARARG